MVFLRRETTEPWHKQWPLEGGGASIIIFVSFCISADSKIGLAFRGQRIKVKSLTTTSELETHGKFKIIFPIDATDSGFCVDDVYD